MHLQGPVPLGDSSYVERSFERKVIRELLAGRWVLLPGPRQHGKTSALARVRKALVEAGLGVGFVDLQSRPPHASYSEFITWVCQTVNDQLNNGHSILPKTGDLSDLFSAVVPAGHSKVAVLIDEASNIPNEDWRNSFYGQLRSISSERAFASENSAAARLSFAFSGTFRPEALIDESNSPFNVCQRIATDNLLEDEVVAMSRAVLEGDNDAAARKIYAEVGGQPFLVQRIFSQIEKAEDRAVALAAAIEDLRSGDSDHVSHLFGRILAEPKLAATVAGMVKQGAVANEPADPDYKYLQVRGIAKREGRTLVFSNAMYSYVAAISPQLGGDAVNREQASIFPLPAAAFGKVQDAKLREIAFSAHTGAVASYRAGSNRLAWAGFGGSLEAVLLDFMARQPAPALAAAVQAAQCNFRGNQNASDPLTWSLFNLIKAAQQITGRGNLEPPQALREWRNTIHPAVTLRQYRTDVEMGPEVRAASLRANEDEASTPREFRP